MINTLKLLIAIIIYCIGWPFFHRKNNIWLIGERPSEAKDNGFHLFKHIRTMHADQEIYYIIKFSSAQREKIEHLGNVIDYNSLKHYLFFLRAKKLVLVFERSTFPESMVIWYWYRLKLIGKSVVFLNHGTIKDNLVHLTYGGRFKFDLFVCSARAEHEYVQKQLGYPSNVARLLGSTRWDALQNTHTTEKVFFMPTWRTWLNGCNIDQFLTSDYHRALTDVINSESLNDLLENANAELVLYLHDVLQPKFANVLTAKSQNVVIATSESHDVQELIKSSTVLITDYSSVAFDFAYLGKPVIYYQFDEEEFFSQHFERGYFDYRKHGFGPVVQDASDVIVALNKTLCCFDHNEEYSLRMEDFFELRDKKNCERSYLAIQEL